MPSMLNKIVSAVTPNASVEARAEARQKARSKAKPGDWLSLVLEHHVELEYGFGAAKSGVGDGGVGARTKLATLLLGHAQAEESILYPAMALKGDEKSGAETAYDEQVMVKIEMAKLEALPPLSQDYQDKLEEIRAAVAQHMYEEEGTWFPTLHDAAAPADQAKLTQRYSQEFQRYMDGGPS